MALRIFADPFAISEQDRIEGGEQRWQTLGSVEVSARVERWQQQTEVAMNIRLIRHIGKGGHRSGKRYGFVAGLSLIALVSGAPAGAETYKYQDEQGRWQYTDRPPSNLRQSGEVLPAPMTKPRPTQNLNAALRAKFSPETPIQEATLSTVTIKTSLATGSGFFISSTGHLLTNKHVIQLPEQERKNIQQTFGDAEQKIERHRQRLAWREQELEKYRKDLAQYEAYLGGLSGGAGKADQQAYYQSRQDQYQTLQQELAADRRQLQAVEDKVATQRRELDWKLAVSGAANAFTIVLKDGVELTAALVAVSPDHDLALLKVDQRQTPFLHPAAPQAIGQGEPVYAIGSPVGLRDSISAGVVSGVDSTFIRTDAKIYPGNSGGPLILANGQVIGINTMKQITEKFEGIGYAIPIATALREFASDLPRD
ncbi:MAG: trypsin-like peptidase domain-containing protein [Candidatus Contendobacter sp.]|nr:trypsin-like peptidase domain-containing protein [Candidatus Contendobacter sp.]